MHLETQDDVQQMDHVSVSSKDVLGRVRRDVAETVGVEEGDAVAWGKGMRVGFLRVDAIKGGFSHASF